MKEKLKDKRTWGYLIPALALVGFILFLYFKGSTPSTGEGEYKIVGYFHGGNGGSDLDVKNIRWHKHRGFERVVFDIYRYNGVLSSNTYVKSSQTGIYQIGKEKEDSLELDGEIKGFSSFSASIPSFYKSKLIDGIEIFPENSDSFIFTIKLKKSTPYKVFTLSYPARIIIDLED